jgi:hypothetical protein
LITIATTPSGVAPFTSTTKGTVRILNAQYCCFSLGASAAIAIPSADFRLVCTLSDLKIYGNGATVAIITE